MSFAAPLKRPALSEKQIENQILNHLRARRVFTFKTQTVGIYDQKLGRFRKAGANYTRGVADILGIFNCRFLAIEVKSAKGRLSDQQKLFLENVLANGGIGFVARSVEEVDEKLKYWNFSGIKSMEEK